jgi:hypothetical protein
MVVQACMTIAVLLVYTEAVVLPNHRHPSSAPMVSAPDWDLVSTG